MSAVDEIAAYLAHLKTSGNRIDQIIFDELPNGEGMTATDELRRLLDGRGVEWGAEESELDHVTAWNANGGQAMFYESKTTNPNLLQVNYYDLTPEQAVEATLGRGTCHIDSMLLIDGEYVPQSYYEYEMECGEGFKWDGSEPPSYCPCCGRKVVDA